MTTLKTRQSEAELAAQALTQHYVASTIVDTILCLDGTQIIGAYLAKELNRAGFISINAHQTIYVVTPEYDTTSQLIFRDNLVPMIRDKHVLILTASVTTGISARKAMECVQYYGGSTAGIATIFSDITQVAPRFCRCEPELYTLFRDADETLGALRDFSHFEHAGCVRIISVQDGGYVHVDNITFLQDDIFVRYTVADLVVD